MEEALVNILKDTPWIGFLVYLVYKVVPVFQQWIESQARITAILGRVARVLEEVEDALKITPESEEEE